MPSSSGKGERVESQGDSGGRFRPSLMEDFLKRIAIKAMRSHFVSSVEEAEGIASRGLRSATFSEDGEVAASRFPYVRHATGWREVRPRPDDELVLVAEDATSARDLTLFSHAFIGRFAARVVLVTPGEIVADGLPYFSSLPGVSEFQEAWKGLSLDSPELSEEELIQWLAAARQAGLVDDRVLLASASVPSRASSVVITMGPWVGTPERLFRSEEKSAGAVVLRALRPFPRETLRKALAGSSEWIVPVIDDSPAHEEMVSQLRDLREEIEEKPEIHVIESEDRGAGRALPPLIRGKGGPEGLSTKLRKVPKTLRLGATPEGDWMSRTLLQLISLSELTRFEIVETGEEGASEADSAEELDFLILLENESVDPRPAVTRVGREGDLLLIGSGEENVGAWPRLSRSTRREVIERELKVWTLTWGESPDGEHDLRERYAEALIGASLRVLDHDLGDSCPEAMHRGFEQVRQLDASVLEASRKAEVPGFVDDDGLPRLAGESEGETDLGWIQRVRDFYLGGETGQCGLEWNTDLPLRPALALGLPEGREVRFAFPYFLGESGEEESGRSLAELVESAVEESDSDILARIKPAILEVAEQIVGDPVDFGDFVDELLEGVERNLDLSERGREKLRAEKEDFREALRREGKIYSFDTKAVIGFWLWAARNLRDEHRRRCVVECRRLVHRLEEILGADSELQGQARSAERLSSSLGNQMADRFDSAALSRLLPSRRGSRGLSSERRERMQRIRTGLLDFVKYLEHLPASFVVTSEDQAPPKGEGLEGRRHSRPIRFALGVFEGLSQPMMEGFRALRRAQLEVDSSYEPERHDLYFKRMTWQSLDSEELLVFPPILVVEKGPAVAGALAGDLSRLLHSGIPVQLVVTTSEGGLTQPLEPSGSDLLDVAGVTLAQRQAFVLQTLLSRPDLLLEGFQQMLGSHRPGVAVVGVPEAGANRVDSVARRRWLTAEFARTVPSYVYDPDRGPTLADRFALVGNRSQEELRVKVRTRFRDAKGRESELTEDCTPAHVAAQLPALREHFLVIPGEAWSSEQVPLTEYLETYGTTTPRAVPFIWVVDRDGRLQRAIVSWQMAETCRHHDLRWRMLQELAGIHNPHVEKALAALREELREEAESGIIQARTEGRREGAEEAVDRLVALFKDPGSAPLKKELDVSSSAEPETEPSKGRERESVEDAATEDESEIEVEEESAEEELPEDPYIESYLCTSCNDCINLNGQMFQYNEEKQAYIADPQAGTFKELVKAAEACPANCIHTGTPRDGDETATEEWVERAKVYR